MSTKSIYFLGFKQEKRVANKKKHHISQCGALLPKTALNVVSTSCSSECLQYQGHSFDSQGIH